MLHHRPSPSSSLSPSRATEDHVVCLCLAREPAIFSVFPSNEGRSNLAACPTKVTHPPVLLSVCPSTVTFPTPDRRKILVQAIDRDGDGGNRATARRHHPKSKHPPHLPTHRRRHRYRPFDLYNIENGRPPPNHPIGR